MIYLAYILIVGLGLISVISWTAFNIFMDEYANGSARHPDLFITLLLSVNSGFVGGVMAYAVSNEIFFTVYVIIMLVMFGSIFCVDWSDTGDKAVEDTTEHDDEDVSHTAAKDTPLREEEEKQTKINKQIDFLLSMFGSDSEGDASGNGDPWISARQILLEIRNVFVPRLCRDVKERKDILDSFQCVVDREVGKSDFSQSLKSDSKIHLEEIKRLLTKSEEDLQKIEDFVFQIQTDIALTNYRFERSNHASVTDTLEQFDRLLKDMREVYSESDETGDLERRLEDLTRELGLAEEEDQEAATS